MAQRRFIVENEHRKEVYQGKSSVDIVSEAKRLLRTGTQRGVCAIVIEPDGTRIKKYTAAEGFVMPQTYGK